MGEAIVGEVDTTSAVGEMRWELESKSKCFGGVVRDALVPYAYRIFLTAALFLATESYNIMAIILKTTTLL